MELRRLAEYLIADENRFTEILARRSIKQVESEKKTVQSELRKSEMRIEIIPKLLKTLYEDKLSGKTSEDNYCVLSQEYSDEREQLQKKILKLRRKLTEMGEKENEREEFIHAIRKFMEMRTLTKQVLNELIDHIDVYETQGTGKKKPNDLSSTTSSSGIWTLIPRSAIRTTLPTSVRVSPLSMFPASRRTV